MDGTDAGPNMKLKLFVANLIAISFSSHAHAYEWLTNQHACVVENANYTSADGERTGTWSNAPKSFFVQITKCRDYAKSVGLPFESGQIPNVDNIYQVNTVNQCADWSGAIEFDVIEVKGLDVEFAPVLGGFLTMLPAASETGTMKFNSDGYINYSEYGETESDSAGAWFMLRANCTILRSPTG